MPPETSGRRTSSASPVGIQLLGDQPRTRVFDAVVACRDSVRVQVQTGQHSVLGDDEGRAELVGRCAYGGSVGLLLAEDRRRCCTASRRARASIARLRLMGPRCHLVRSHHLHPEIDRRERVGITEGAHGDVRGRPRTFAGISGRRACISSRSAPRSRTRSPLASAEADSAAFAVARRHADLREVRVGDHVRSWEQMRRPPHGFISGLPSWSSDVRPASCTLTDTCWPSTARTRARRVDQRPGPADLGGGVTDEREERVAADVSSTATGSASRSRERLQRWTAACGSRTSPSRACNRPDPVTGSLDESGAVQEVERSA